MARPPSIDSIVEGNGKYRTAGEDFLVGSGLGSIAGLGIALLSKGKLAKLVENAGKGQSFEHTAEFADKWANKIPFYGKKRAQFTAPAKVKTKFGDFGLKDSGKLENMFGRLMTGGGATIGGVGAGVHSLATYDDDLKKRKIKAKAALKRLIAEETDNG